MHNKIKIGFDFDGVIAYNPFRVIRSPISSVKKKLFGIKRLHFYYPKNSLERFIWKVLHESSVFPSRGIDLLHQLVEEDRIEAHLITARYSFLDDHLFDWLKRNKLDTLFKTVNWNKQDEQPHVFKHKMVTRLGLHYFIEDNLDIVLYLHGKSKTKIYWIYNLLDRGFPHPHKHPYLRKALEEIMKNELT